MPRSLAASRQLCQQGVAALERGQWDAAEKTLSQAVATCPSDPDAHRYYAEALWNRGARKEALAQLEKAQQLPADDAGLAARMAEMRLGLGQNAPALEMAQRAIRLDPRLPAAWVARARVLRAMNRGDDALGDYQRALGASPDDRATQLEMAELYLGLNRPERALATVQSLGQRYSPGDEPPQVLYLEGMSQMALGRFDDASASLSAAAVRGRPTPEILYRLAEARLSAGQVQEAVAAARDALAIDPGHQPSQQLLRRLDLAREPGGPAIR